jgi:hypothetical protein
MFYTYLFIKCLTFYISVKESTQKVIRNLYGFFHHVFQYWKKTNKIWLLMDDHTLPLSLDMIHNEIESSWYYHSESNILSQTKEVCPHSYSLSWLSAKLIIHHTEYDMDEFLSQYRVHTVGEIYPTLTVLFLSWCIHSKHWFLPHTPVIFEVIDAVGDEKQYVLEVDTLPLRREGGRLFYV